MSVAQADDGSWRAADATCALPAESLSVGYRIGAFCFLLVGYFCYAWSWNTVDVLRPYIAADLHLTLTQAGSLYSGQAAGALLGAVINGQLADRFGRRNALFVVMLSYGLLLVSGAFVTSYLQVLGQRFALGYFTGTMYPITVGIYVTLFPPALRGRLAGVALGVYNAAVALLGAAGALVLDHDWRALLYVGAIPAALAGLAFLVMPDDRRIIPHGAIEADRPMPRLPILELFAPTVRRQTLLLVLMCGMNFFAYQAFTGWVTTYLSAVRHLNGAAIGVIVSWQFWGSCLGGFAWGWVSDRFGRRVGAFGFLAGAAIILLYLAAPPSVSLIGTLGFLYGFCISASVVWGPWLTELYPSHLRSTAASIFNWGRAISFFAPLITATVARRFGLVAAMTMASGAFVLAMIVWLRLPETLNGARHSSHRPRAADA